MHVRAFEEAVQIAVQAQTLPVGLRSPPRLAPQAVFLHELSLQVHSPALPCLLACHCTTLLWPLVLERCAAPADCDRTAGSERQTREDGRRGRRGGTTAWVGCAVDDDGS